MITASNPGLVSGVTVASRFFATCDQCGVSPSHSVLDHFSFSAALLVAKVYSCQTFGNNFGGTWHYFALVSSIPPHHHPIWIGNWWVA